MLDQTTPPASALKAPQAVSAAAIPVVLIPGDGVGPEVARAAMAVISAACPAVDWIEAEGGAAVMARGEATGLPAETLRAVEEAGVVLKGPLATPVGHGGKSANVTLRKMFELYANIRPIRALPGVKGPYEGREIDFTIVRENVEDLYAGIEHMQTPDVAQCLKLITREGSEKIARLAFALAEAEGRGSVVCASKSNIMKLTEGLFQRSFEAIASEHPDVEAVHMLVDNCAQQMVLRPEQFEVVVTTNMNGDILSDLAAGLVGGLGLAPSANIGDGMAMFEAVHGSAPDIAGQDRANPTALILAGAMMLRHVGRPAEAARIETAVRLVYAKGRNLTAGVARNDRVGSTSRFETLDSIPPFEHSSASSAAPFEPPKARRASPRLRRSFDGVDVFVEWHGETEMLAHELNLAAGTGRFRLSMISNRGTIMWPDGSRHADHASHWRCRFLADSEDAEIRTPNLLSAVGERLRWMHVEKLESYNGLPAYSLAQGEAAPIGREAA